MPEPINPKGPKRSDELPAAGLRPVQIWVPATRRPGFIEECHRQSLDVGAADAADDDLKNFLEAALADLADEEES